MEKKQNKALPDRFLRMLGLCRRAGGVLIGTSLVYDAMRGKKPPLLVLSSEQASEPTKKKTRTMCAFYKIPLAEVPYRKEELAHAVGKSGEIGTLGITDARFLEEFIITRGENAPESEEAENKDGSC